MKKLIVLVIVTLFLVGCGVPEEDYQAAQEQITALETQLKDAKTNLESANTEIETLSSELKITQDQLTSTSDELTTVETEVERLTLVETEYFSVTETLSDTQSALNKLIIDYDALEDEKNGALRAKRAAETELGKHICDTQISNMKYTNIMDISTQLMGWYATRSYVDMVHGSYRDTIWNNTDTKIHSIRYRHADDGETYVDHFLVYFDEFGWKKGVYWLSEQCWLAGGP